MGKHEWRNRLRPFDVKSHGPNSRFFQEFQRLLYQIHQITKSSSPIRGIGGQAIANVTTDAPSCSTDEATNSPVMQSLT